MRHRLFSRVLTLAVLSFVALPAAAHGAARRSRPHPAAGTAQAACSAARVATSEATLGKAASATLCLLNRERSDRGLKPLRSDGQLAKAARAHSQEMVRKRFFEHESLDGRSPFDRILATRYVPRGASWTLGENIGWGTLELATPEALVKAWMKSPGHRQNILNPRFREIGIGIVAGVPIDDPELIAEEGATYTTDFGVHS